MLRISSLSTIFYFLFYLFAATAAADSLSSPHNLTYLFQTDETGVDTHSLSASLAVSESVVVFLAGDKTIYGEDEGDFEARSFYGGLSYDISDNWGIGYSYDLWGDDGFIEIHSHRFDLSFFRGDWVVSISPEYKVIEVTFNDVDWEREWSNLPETVQQNAFSGSLERFLLFIDRRVSALESEYEGLDVFGLSLSAGFYGYERAYISASLTDYDYSRDVSELDLGTAMTDRVLSPSTYLAIDGFVDWQFELDWGYFHDKGRFSLNWGYFVSAITQDELSTYTASAGWPLTKTSELLAEFGVSDSGEGGRLTYGGLGLSYSF